jgi:urea carboxylase
MEGPGGYQFVGRTVQVYNRFKTTKQFEANTPWLLRFFDQIKFYPVDAAELLEMRAAFPHGRLELKIEEQRFKLADYRRFLAQEAESIAAFRMLQRTAFAEERQRWVDSGQLNFSVEQTDAPLGDGAPRPEWAGAQIIESGVPGSIWKVLVSAGQRVEKGQTCAIVESMKMEIAVESPIDGVVVEVVTAEGKPIAPGQPVVVVRPHP